MQNNFFTQFKEYKIAKDDIFLYAQNVPTGVFYLKRGFVRQYSISKEGKELTIHIYMPGSFFPLFWAINNEKPDYNLQALTFCTVCVSPKEQFLDWIKNNPKMLYSLSSRLLYGLSGLKKRVEVISLDNSSQRVISILKYLSDHFGKKSSNGHIKITPYFTHESIAALTGLTRERVSIEMKTLKNKNKINYKRGTLIILDRTKL
ncbi:MAG: Crp/Fnr family transcriptional regulator [Candidatus Woesebacteria bacterium GW2011_GWB1_38_5b]|uniref:Crp/Fnr family transcriptional regulator n=1 Tax=Candidatus Woesebacteria bacterium GW2011_GWB1_38_5b TaxID=1618569 RepID=A0A0G0MPA2_9BACT|nr:MAG: Crp/Fnr family transcriptional regulator [Candidatus Woesebacteria bacterium GW2011_GWB1_38_5b]